MIPADSFSSIPCICAKVSIAYRQIHKIYGSVMRQTGLSNEQVSILLALHRMGGMRQGELGRRFAIDRTSLSRNLKRLTESGLVEARKLDQKSIGLSLTRKGKEKILSVLPLWQKVQQKVTAVLGQHSLNEIDRLNDVLKTIPAK